MSKSPTKKKRSDIDTATFSADVQAILELLKDGRSDEVLAYPQNAGKFVEEAKVARTLAYVQRLVYDDANFENRELNANAQSLLEAISLGRDHPIHFHLRGMQKSRRGKPLLATPEQLKKAVVLALVEILRRSGSSTPWSDVVSIAFAHRIPGLTQDTMKGWRQRSDKTLDAMVENYLALVTENARKYGRDERAIAIEWVKVSWGAVLNTPT